jgi:hypothetical protein
MNTRRLYILAALFFVILFQARAQIPPQLHAKEWTYFQPTRNTGVSITEAVAVTGDLASDGAGHHYVVQDNNQIQHYLFDNLGNLISSSTFGSDAAAPSVTARNGRIHVTLHDTSLNRIELWRSADAGTSWTFVDSRPVSGQFYMLDAYEDDRGVHLVYSSSQGIFYYCRLPSDFWAGYMANVYPSQFDAIGLSPIVTASPYVDQDSAHVLSTGSLRSFKFPANTTEQGLWVESTGPWLGATYSFNALAFAKMDDGHPYAFAIGQIAGDVWYSRAHRRYDAASSWTINITAQPLPSPRKISAVLAPGYPWDKTWPNFVWDEHFTTEIRVALARLAVAQGTPPQWGAMYVSGARNGEFGVLGGNQGSIVAMWRDQQDQTLYFRRKPYPVVGELNENYVFTDTSWIIGPATLAAGKELRLKAGSVTYIWGQSNFGGPGNLHVASEGSEVGSLVVESGAKLFLESPTQAGTVGGILELGDNVTCTVETGGILEANSASQFLLGKEPNLL